MHRVPGPGEVGVDLVQEHVLLHGLGHGQARVHHLTLLARLCPRGCLL